MEWCSTASFTEMNNLADIHLVIFEISPFLANIPILYTLKTPKNVGLVVFSGGTKREHWPEMRSEK